MKTMALIAAAAILTGCGADPKLATQPRLGTESKVATESKLATEPTASPAAREYVAVTPSLATNPASVPDSAGSAAPNCLLAADGVTDAARRAMANVAEPVDDR